MLAWADGLLTTYANRRAIIASHYIINAGNPGSFGTQGQAIYTALKGHANLFLMLCGHVTPPEGRRTDTFNGNTVYSLLSDYQDNTNGGNGFLRIYEFSPANNVIRARTYSPWLNQFETDADSSSQFTLAYNMGGTTPFQLIGTRSGVASGASASVTWASLAANTAYEWYAVASDGSASATSATWRFTTGSNSNLVSNGGFEANIAGWARYGTPALSQGTEGHSGTRSLQIKGPSSTAAFGCDDSPNTVTAVAKVGAIYRFSAWVKAPGTSRGKVKLRVYELLGSVQQGSTTYSPELALTSGWQLLSVDYTVRVAGTALSLRVTDAPLANGETFLVDDVSITLLSVPGSAATSGDGAAAGPLAGVGGLAPPLVFSATVMPNPARGGARLNFVTTREGFARAALYDASGRRVRELINEQRLAPGAHRLDLDARSGGHGPLASGIYFYRIEASEGVLGGRCVFIQ